MVHIVHWADQVCNFHVQRAFGCQVAEDPGISFAGGTCAALPSLISYLDEMLQAQAPPQAPGQTPPENTAELTVGASFWALPPLKTMQLLKTLFASKAVCLGLLEAL